MQKAFLGRDTGRTNLFFGQPMTVELFAIPSAERGPYIHPHLPQVTLALTDDKGKAVPFEIDEGGGGGAGEFVHFQLRPTKPHAAGGYWKPGTYKLKLTVVIPDEPLGAEAVPVRVRVDRAERRTPARVPEVQKPELGQAEAVGDEGDWRLNRLTWAA